MRSVLPRTLRARLTAGLIVLLAVAFLTVGTATVLVLQASLTERLDQQLVAVAGSFSERLERREVGNSDSLIDARAQTRGTFGARVVDGEVAAAAVVGDSDTAAVDLSSGDRAVLAAIPADGTAHTVTLDSLGAYRVVATADGDQDGADEATLITGLPLHPVEEVVVRLRWIEVSVFGLVIVITGIAGAQWVRISLRPLRRVTATAAAVTASPLASGEVEMPDPVPDTDPRTEVGQVGLALNRMLVHIGDALARRHESEEQLRRFAADASHELRTPVATIRAHAELALKSQEGMPGEVRHALERIQSQARRMGTLVDDLLLLARLDAGRPLATEQVDVTRLTADATDDARASGPDHYWRLELPAEPVTIVGDEHRLHQVIANLLANARIHTAPGTVVTVSLTEARGQVTLAVTDDGPGIPAELQSEVFGRFTRGDRGRSRSAGGTGLGLSIVSAVVTAHRGTTELTSRPGHTRFIVVLPAVAPESWHEERT